MTQMWLYHENANNFFMKSFAENPYSEYNQKIFFLIFPIVFYSKIQNFYLESPLILGVPTNDSIASAKAVKECWQGSLNLAEMMKR